MKRVSLNRYGLLNRRLLVWSGGLIFFLAAFLLWQRGPAMPPPIESEQAVLTALETEYKLESYSLDDQGHVIGLKMDGKRFDDGAVDRACQLKWLQSLSLAGSSISDAGVKKIAQLKHLHSLTLASAQVTDTGLGYLAKSRSLHYMWLQTTSKMTSRGVDSLKRSIPGVQVFLVNRFPKK